MTAAGLSVNNRLLTGPRVYAKVDNFEWEDAHDHTLVMCAMLVKFGFDELPTAGAQEMTPKLELVPGKGSPV